MRKYWQDYQQQIMILITSAILLVDVILIKLGYGFAIKILPILLAIIASICILFWNAIVRKKVFCFISILFSCYMYQLLIAKVVFTSGEITFGNIIGIRLFGVPLIIGLIWFLAIVGTLNIITLGNINRTNKKLLASLIILMFVLVLEQFASSSNAWVWNIVQTPILNYILWIF
ncbi:MAG: carotenoid biosynthesis protein, partial [Candidatus Saccharibacteria bacterium]